MCLPGAGVCAVCAVVELQQLSAVLGQKDADLNGTTHNL